MMYKNYKKIRKNLKGLSKLFWDLLFGNEYMVALVKYPVYLLEQRKIS